MPKPEKQINLMRGWPSPSLLPNKLLASASQRILSDPDLFVPSLQYGADPGYQPLREALATWLSSHYGVTRDAERICISGGASQNVARLMQSFTDPAVTKAVWVIAPCYHLVCAIYEDAGFAGRLRAFPEDEEGVDLDELERRILKVEEEFKNKPQGKPYKAHGQFRKFYDHIIYVVPTSANPSGKTMSLRRREALVKLARKYNALIICDDVYDFLQWPLEGDASALNHPEALLPRLVDIDLAMGRAEDDPQGFGYAISNGSFSKLAGPGMRTGWCEGSRAFAFGLAQTGSTKSGGSPSQFCGSMLAQLVGSGELQEYLATTMRPALQRRHRVMMNAIKEHVVPHGLQYRSGGLVDGSVYGGYFIWLGLEEGMSSQLIGDVALAEENLIIGTGRMFEVRGDEASFTFDNAIRLTFSWVSEDDLVEGVKRLGSVIQRIKNDPARYESQASTPSDKSAIIDSSK